jgi:Protein of unknown function (DUF3160)/FlgD Ig-like domain
MNTHRVYGLLSAIALFACTAVYPQVNPGFDSTAYIQFLSTHQNLTTSQLQSLYPAGTFLAGSSTNFSAAKYFDSVDTQYGLSSGEKSLLGKQGFVVTERVRFASYGDAYLDLYTRDLPVFVSTDAILHALHMSWDNMLMEIENFVLVNSLDTLLANLHDQLPTAAAYYSSSPAMKQMINDVDVYLTVPRVLLGKAVGPKFAENNQTVQDLLTLIKAEAPASYPLFSGTPRTIDFSQFTVRGHYTRSPILSEYFQAMIWLGRTEIYLIPPESADKQQIPADIQRQIIDAALLKEIADRANAFPRLEQIDGILRSFIGESDNVTLPNVADILTTTGISNASELLDSSKCALFDSTLAQKSYAFQRINSQILMSDPMSPEQIRPASSFLLLGQRFIVDSYTTGNVVYDKILYNGVKVTRMLPSPLDVLFATGNNAAAQLLKPELDQYHYSSNLTALRYLIDSYEPAFWQSTVYDGWLNSIRALNPPADRSTLPPFMQTAAWWQEKMNTQLASWAELRHDFILYAKQSYSGGTSCSFPESYVEPIPQFYDALKAFAESGISIFQSSQLQYAPAVYYFTAMSAIADTLGSIARKELSGTSLTDAEKSFLKTMLYSVPAGCAVATEGWYSRLFYSGSGLRLKDLIIADIHTAPTDAAGAPVGWVLHVGTGPLNLAVVVAKLPDGTSCSFVGPVSSYYEYLATNFTRLTDEEWVSLYNVSPSLRPSFVNLYLADTMGFARPEGSSLVMNVSQQQLTASPTTLVLGKNFPNPFNSSTIITFTIPSSLANSDADLALYDIQGRLVKRIVSRRLPAGNFAARWDGTSDNGVTVSTGVYFYRLTVGSQHQVGKLSFLK